MAPGGQNCPQVEPVYLETKLCVLHHRAAILSLVQCGEVKKGKMRHQGSMEFIRS